MPISVILKMRWGALEEKYLNCNLRKHPEACASVCAWQDLLSSSLHREGKNIRHQTVDAHSIQAIIAHCQEHILTFYSVNATLWIGNFHKGIHLPYNLSGICDKSWCLPKLKCFHSAILP